MANNEEGFGIQIEVARLGTNSITKQIQDQLNKIQNLSIKIDKVNTDNIRKSIQKAIEDAYKNIKVGKLPTPEISTPSGGTKPPKIEDFYPKGYKEKLARIEAGFRTMGKNALEASDDFKQAQATYRAFEDAVNSGDIEKAASAQALLQKQVRGASSDLSIARNKAKGYDKELDAIGRRKLGNYLQKWLDTNTAATKEARMEVQGYINDINNGLITTQSQEKAIRSVVETRTNEMRQMNRLGSNFIDTFNKGAKKFVDWGLASGATMKGIHTVKEMYQTVKDVDTAMTELEKVSDATGTQITKSLQESTKTAKTYAASISDVVNATADWSRLGYNLPDSNELAKVATIYKNVGDGIDIDTANKSLVSTLQGFQLEAEDALSIIDKFNEVANNFPIDTAGIGEALQRSAASFYAANTDLSKSIALISGTNSVVQDPDSVGTMWKTVSMRVRGATTELEEAGLETEGMVETTAQLRDLVMGLTNFDIMKDENTFKDIYDIIVGIGEKWGDLKDIEQASLLEALAGKRQGNALSAALNNIDMIKNAYSTAEDSAGSAMREQETYLKSVEAKSQQFEAAFESLSTSIINSDLIKWFVDFGTISVSTLEKIINLTEQLLPFADGGITSASAIAGAILGAKGVGPVSYDFEKDGFSWKNFSSPWLEAFRTKAFEVTDDVKSAFWELRDEISYRDGDKQGALKSLLSSDNLDENLREFWSDDTISEQAKTSTEAYKDWATNVKHLGKQFDFAKVKAVALNTAMNAAVSIGISLAIQAAVTALNDWVHASEILEEKATNFTNSVNQAFGDMSKNTKTLSELNSEYQSLSKGVNALGENVSLSSDQYDRYKGIISQVSAIMPNMTTYFNSQGEKIAFAKDRMVDLNAEYEKYIQKQSKMFLANGDEDGNTFEDVLNNNQRKRYKKSGKIDDNRYGKTVVWNEFKRFLGFKGKIDDYEPSIALNMLKQIQNKTQQELYSSDAYGMSLGLMGKYPGDIKNMTQEQFNSFQEEITAHIETLSGNIDADMAKITSGLLQTVYSKDEFWNVDDSDIRNNITTLVSSINSDVWDKLNLSTPTDVSVFINKIINAMSQNKDGFTDAWNGLLGLKDNSDISTDKYISQVKAFINTLGNVLGIDENGKNQFMVSLGFDISTTDSDLQNVKAKLQDAFDDKAGELSLGDLKIAANNLEIPPDTLLTWDELLEKIAKYKEENPQPIVVDSKLTENIDKIQSAYKTMRDAIKEYNKEGYISVDTYQSLLDLGGDYLKYLFDENGNLRLNEQALQNVTIARIEELGAQQKQAIFNGVIEKCTDEETAQKYLKQAIEETTQSYDDLLNKQLETQRLKWLDNGISETTVNALIDNIKGQWANTDSLTNKAVDGIKTGFGITGESAKDTADKIKDLNKKIADTNEQLSDLAKSEATDKIKYKFDQWGQSIEKVDNALSLLGNTLDLTAENDYEAKLGIVTRQLGLAQEKSSLLRGEFAELSVQEYNSAAFAQELASRMESVAKSMAENNKDIIEYGKNIAEYYTKALNYSSEMPKSSIDEATNLIDRNIKALSEGSLTGLQFNLSPTIPKSALEKQRAQNRSMEAEMRSYYDKVAQMQKTALDLEFQEQMQANAKQRAELIESLNEAKKELAEYSGTVQNVQKTTNQSTSAEQKRDHVEKQTETQSFADAERSIITGLNDWMTQNPIIAPELDKPAWEQMVADAENYAQRIQSAFSNSVNMGTVNALGITKDSDISNLQSGAFGDGRSALIAAARSQIGYREGKDNANKFSAYGVSHHYSDSAAEAWCNDFVSWAAVMAGLEGSIPLGAGTQTTASEFGINLKSANSYTPKIGDIAYYSANGKKNGINHVEIVTGFDNKGNLITIGGNTGRNGEVAERVRKDKPAFYGTYSKGTKDFGLAGENHKKEWAINKKTGEWSKVDSPTLFDKKEYDIVSEDVSEKIDKPIPTYSNGTLSVTTDPSNRLDDIAASTKETADNTGKMAAIDLETELRNLVEKMVENPDEEEYQKALLDYVEKNTEKGRDITEELVSAWDAMQAKQVSKREQFNGYNQKLAAAVNTDDFAPLREQITGEMVEYADSMVEESVKATAQTLKQTYEQAKKAQDTILAYYNERKAAGANSNELKAIQDAYNTQTKIIQEYSDQYVSTMTSYKDYIIGIVENEMKSFSDRISWKDKDTEKLERQLDKADSPAEKSRITKELIALDNDKASIYEEQKATAHKNAMDFRNDESFAELFKQFSWDDIEEWFDANGELTAEFQDELKAIGADESTAYLVSDMQRLAGGIQVCKKSYYEADEALVGLKDHTEELAEAEADRKLDTYLKGQERVAEIIDYQAEKQQKLIDAQDKAYKTTQSLRNAQAEIDKEIRANMQLAEWLDDDTRRWLFNEDDYAAETKAIQGIQSEMDKLTANYQKQISNLDEKDWYQEQALTAEYERQIDALNEKLDVAKQTLGVAKKQAEFENRAKERDTQIILGNRVVNVADPTEMHRIASEKAEAEIALDNTKKTNSENQNLRDMQKQNDATEQESAAIQNRIDMINRMTDEEKRVFAGLLEPIEVLQAKLNALKYEDPNYLITRDNSDKVVAERIAGRSDVSLGYSLDKDHSQGVYDLLSAVQNGILSLDDAQIYIDRLQEQHNYKTSTDPFDSGYKQFVDAPKYDEKLLKSYDNQQKGLLEQDQKYNDIVKEIEAGKYKVIEPSDMLINAADLVKMMDLGMSDNMLSEYMSSLVGVKIPSINNVQNTSNNPTNRYTFTGDIIVSNPVPDANTLVGELAHRTNDLYPTIKNNPV